MVLPDFTIRKLRLIVFGQLSMRETFKIGQTNPVGELLVVVVGAVAGVLGVEIVDTRPGAETAGSHLGIPGSHNPDSDCSPGRRTDRTLGDSSNF